MLPAEDFDDFYLATRDRLVVSLTVLIGDVDHAGDAVDEAFERALSRWGRVSRMDSPAGWTYRVAAERRSTPGRRRTMERRLLGRPESHSVLPSQVIEVREILDGLPPRAPRRDDPAACSAISPKQTSPRCSA